MGPTRRANPSRRDRGDAHSPCSLDAESLPPLAELVGLPLRSTQNWSGQKRALLHQEAPVAVGRASCLPFFGRTELATRHAAFFVKRGPLFGSDGSLHRCSDGSCVARLKTRNLFPLMAAAARNKFQRVRFARLEFTDGRLCEFLGYRPESHDSIFRAECDGTVCVECNQNEEVLTIRETPQDLELLSAILCMAWNWIERPSCD